VPQVASETNAHLINHAYRPARPGSAPGHKPTSAFETMLDESARAAADRTRSSSVSDKASIERPTSRPPAESEPARTATTDDAGRTADPEPADGKPADSKSDDGKAGDTDKGEIAEPLASAESDVEAPAEVAALTDESAAADAAGKTDADGENEVAQAGTEMTEAAGEPPKPDPDIIDDGKAVDDSGTGAGKTGRSEPMAAKTAPAVAPTPTAAAHSENVTHAADAAEGRTPPAAAAALQAAATKPADAQAKGEEKKVAAGELPPQSKAEDAHVRSEQRPALPEHIELPAQSNRNALADHASMSLPNNGLQFSLRDQANGQHQERTDCGDAARLVVEDESLPAPETIAGTRFTGRDGGVDTRV
jgi:hypothetical protein